MPERRLSPTASIPSKHRGRSAGGEVRGSLIVKKLKGMTSSEESDVTTLLNGVVLPNAEAMSKMNSSRLAKDIKIKLNNMEYDGRSLEMLMRLLKSGPIAHDVINDENRRPPDAPAPSVENLNVVDDGAEAVNTNRGLFMVASARTGSSRSRSAVTSDPSAKFRKSIQELKSARERFGISMSVNGNIAKVRSAQQKNLRTRKETRRTQETRNVLPALSISSSGESASVDGEKHSSPRRHVSVMRPWLTLSGRRIQLKHQGHVERALGQSEIRFIQPELDVMPRPLKRRLAKTAPPRGQEDKSVTLHRFAWSDGNKFVLEKVSKSFRSRTPVNFSETLHGYQSCNPSLDVLGKSEEHTPETPQVQDKKEGKIEEKIREERKVFIDTIQEPPKPTRVPTPPPSCHSNESSSRPSSSTMPRPVRSVVIKLPQTDVMTSSSSTFVASSPPVTTPRYPNTLPSKPMVKFNLKRPK